MIRLWSAEAPLAWSISKRSRPRTPAPERAAQPVGRTRADRRRGRRRWRPSPGAVGHAPSATGRPSARRSARRSTATTVIASVIRPSRVIARTSSNGQPADARAASVPSGVATPWRQAGRDEQDRELVRDAVGQVDAGQLAPVGGVDAGLLEQLAPGTLEGASRPRARRPPGSPRRSRRARSGAGRRGATRSSSSRTRTPAARLAKWTTP